MGRMKWGINRESEEKYIEDYKPLDCQICKMCKVWNNPLYDSGEVTCMKYEVRLGHCRQHFDSTYKPHTYERLKDICHCNKVYPSRWKMFWFKVDTFFKKRADKKYHRDEI